MKQNPVNYILLLLFHLCCASGVHQTFIQPFKQRVPTTWVRWTKLSSNNMLDRKPQCLLWWSNPGSLFLPVSHFLSSSSRNHWKDSCSLEVAKGNSKCQPHTHEMSNTHSSPWCGGTLINRISDSFLVFEKESQWVVAAFEGWAAETHTVTHYSHPTSMLSKKLWVCPACSCSRSVL